MKKLVNCGLFFIITLFCSCSETAHKGNSKHDFDEILMFSLDEVLKNTNLAPDYYNQPLQIVKSKKFPIGKPIVVNGKTCILLPESTQKIEIIQKMDIFKPVPLVEIDDFKYTENSTIVKLIFRATGRYFVLQLSRDKKGRYAVSKMEDFDI